MKVPVNLVACDLCDQQSFLVITTLYPFEQEFKQARSIIFESEGTNLIQKSWQEKKIPKSYKSLSGGVGVVHLYICNYYNFNFTVHFFLCNFKETLCCDGGGAASCPPPTPILRACKARNQIATLTFDLTFWFFFNLR